MTLTEDLSKSRNYEMNMYLSSLKSMYDNSVLQNAEIYDIAARLTDDFQAITADAIVLDSRIIKTLRYSIAPSISQMKFGQFFGINSIGKYENDKINQGTIKFTQLKKIADIIADFASKNIDQARFMWLDKNNKISDIILAKEYAKKWTCSIAADQNAQTRYRNWRKDQQEHSIATKLVDLGYVKCNYLGLVEKHTDIKIGEFTNEIRVKGRTIQKADVVVRSKKDHKLVLIEAKAVGVEIDSTKRIKECCDKSHDWGSSVDLSDPVIVSVIAGFFKERGIKNLQASNIIVVWEHRLSDFKKIL